MNVEHLHDPNASIYRTCPECDMPFVGRAGEQCSECQPRTGEPFDYDTPASELVSVPVWINYRDSETKEVDSISAGQVIEVAKHGCSGGSWMPCVTYHTAMQIMSDHGDAVISYLEECGIEELTFNLDSTHWYGFASTILSMAVEYWCGSHCDLFEDKLSQEE